MDLASPAARAAAALLALALPGLAAGGESNPAQALFARMERKLLAAATLSAAAVAHHPLARVEGSVALGGGGRARLAFGFSGAKALPPSEITCDGESCRYDWLGEAGVSDAPAHLGRDVRVYLARVGVCALYPFPWKEVFDATRNLAPLDPRPDPRAWARLADFTLGPLETVEGRAARRIGYRLEMFERGELAFDVKLWLDLATDLPLRRSKAARIDGETLEVVETYRIALDPALDRRLFFIPGEAERLRPRRLLGDWGAIRTLAFSPDGTRLASAGTDHVVRLWDTATWSEAGRLTGQGSGATDHLSSVAFRPDGEVFASASGDGEIRLRAAGSGELRATLSGHQGGVSAIAFAPAGGALASASLDQTVRTWDADGRPLRTIATGVHLEAVAWSPDGRHLAWSGFGDKESTRLGVSVAATGAEVFRADGHGWETAAVAFDPDGETIVAADGSGLVARDAATGAVVRALAGVRPTAVAFRPDGRMLAVGTDGVIVLVDPRSGEEVRRLTRIGGMVPALAFSPDGKTLASGGFRAIDIWTLGD